MQAGARGFRWTNLRAPVPRHQPCAGLAPRQRGRSPSFAPRGIPRELRHSASIPEESSEVWERLSLLKRQLAVAVSEEDYAAAARLKKKHLALQDTLPPVQRYLLSHVDKLRSADLAERVAAVTTLGESGDELVVPELAACLLDRQLHEAAEDAMLRIFHTSRQPDIQRMLRQGTSQMQDAKTWDLAMETFDSIIRQQPSFAEGYNKKATLLYLMGKYEASIEECHVVLQINPYHFAAASGMGMCYLKINKMKEALKAFDLALQINPYMSAIAKYREIAKASLEETSKSDPGTSSADSM